MGRGGARAGRFVYQRPELESQIGQFSRTGGRFRVLDADGWVLSDAGSVEPREIDLESASWAASAFRWALRRDDPPYPRSTVRPGRGRHAPRRARGEAATAWYGDDPDATPSSRRPCRSRDRAGLGAVLLEQASDPILTLTNQALVRLMTFTLLASVLASVGPARLRDVAVAARAPLAHAAETALGPQGEIRIAIPGRGARDEIGALARSFTICSSACAAHRYLARSRASCRTSLARRSR